MKFNLIDRVKLPFRKDKELYLSLYSILGFYPRNIEIYKTALAHKSSSFRTKLGTAVNNERLEFLGDAILEATVSDILYTHFPNKREGFLTSTRSKLVQRETLNQLAAELGLDRLVKHSAHTNSHNNYIGGNAFEALIGAIYIDRGYERSKWFVAKRILGKALDIDGVAHTEVNFKSKLLEWSQKNHLKMEFRMRDSHSMNPNDPDFDCVVIIETIEAGFGKGFSKKESHQNAAREALRRIQNEQNFVSKVLKVKENREALEKKAQQDSQRPSAVEKPKPAENKPKAQKVQPRSESETAKPAPSGHSERNVVEPKELAAVAEKPKPRKKRPAKTDKPAASVQSAESGLVENRTSVPGNAETSVAAPSAEQPTEAVSSEQPKKKPSRRRRRPAAPKPESTDV